MRSFLLLSFLVTIWSCQSCGINLPTKYKPTAEAVVDSSGLPLHLLKLPEGFSISVWAQQVPNARGMSIAPDGTVFVGSRSEGTVMAIRDKDGNGKADTYYTLASGIQMPVGVAWYKGDLYISAVSQILKLPDVLNYLDDPTAPIIVTDKYPTDTHHGWKYIAFGPDGKLYIPVGAPCNNCESKEPIYASITRMNPDGSGIEIIQRGIRNTVGFTWHPETEELWFTDNGRDWMGDDMPGCELNRASKDSLHFGYPYCHQGDLQDTEFGKKADCAEFVAPVRVLGPHVAALGLEFINGTMFPSSMKHHILIAEHGSWNRSTPIGYRVMHVDPNAPGGASYEPFIDGWLQDGKCWGRPVDLKMMADGSYLLSDDYANCIYRISYSGK